jgi:hypothetical protein
MQFLQQQKTGSSTRNRKRNTEIFSRGEINNLKVGALYFIKKAPQIAELFMNSMIIL